MESTYFYPPCQKNKFLSIITAFWECRVAMKCLLITLLWFSGLAYRTLLAADWPQYRGPVHDGSSPENLRTNWSTVPPRVVWRKSISPAWSSISVSGGRAFTQVHRSVSGQSSEICVALDADTGTELWATPVDTADYPDAGTGSTDGPRSTPTVEGNRVYVLTSYLKLFCLQADSGTVIWSRDFVTEFPGTEIIRWQNAASPLLVGDLIFFNSNVANQTLTAVRKTDGATVWSGQTDAMTHASPTYANIGGTPQVVFLTSRGLLGMEPETGTVLWRHGFTPSSTSTAATPVVANDYLYASCAYSLGAWTAKVTRSGGTFLVGQTDYKRSSSYQNHWATPVHHQGYLYSFVERGSRSLACFSLVGRTNTWTTSTVGSGNPGYGSLIKVGGKLLILTERGELVLLEPNPAAYTEIARYPALGGKSWNHPAFSKGRIYARSNSEIVALDTTVETVPLPNLRLTAQLLPEIGLWRLRVITESPVPLTANEGARIQIQLASSLGSGLPDWRGIETVFTEKNGGLEVDMPLLDSPLFVRVLERTGP